MEDAGVTSFSSSVSVDISLETLELSSSTNADDSSPSAANCSGSSDMSTSAAPGNATAIQESDTETELAPHPSSAAKVDMFSGAPDPTNPANVELQR